MLSRFCQEIFYVASGTLEFPRIELMKLSTNHLVLLAIKLLHFSFSLSRNILSNRSHSNHLSVIIHMEKNGSKRKILALDKKEFQIIVDLSDSFSDVCRKIGLKAFSGNIQTVQRRIKNEEINLTLFNLNNQKRKQKLTTNASFERRTPIEEIFIENSKYKNNSGIKKKLTEIHNIPNVCSECGQTSTHNHKPLMLQLDHINGINDDNRLTNLRLLCPNCHSQTETFCNKKIYLCGCGVKINRKSKSCQKCFPRKIDYPTKITWPSVAELQKLLWEKPCSSIAKELGVSDKSIEKYAKKHNLTKPPRGYWQKAAVVGNDPT